MFFGNFTDNADDSPYAAHRPVARDPNDLNDPISLIDYLEAHPDEGPTESEMITFLEKAGHLPMERYVEEMRKFYRASIIKEPYEFPSE